jgi:hypothetical protein
MTELTIEHLREAMALVAPPLYFATDGNIKRGELYLCKEGDYNPEFIICHPDDLDDIKSKITNRTLVHISNEPAESRLARMHRLIKPLEVRP